MSFQGQDIATQLKLVDEQERKLKIQRALTLEKAFRSGDVDAIFKAQQYNQQMLRQQDGLRGNRFANSGIEGMKSIVLDPYETSGSMGYYSKASSITNNVLRGMARTPIISAIRKTRKNQVSDFTKPQPDKYANGFIIKKKGAKESDKISDADKRIIEKLTNFIVNCGDEDHKWELDDFNTFTRKLVDDSLTLDAGTFEIIPNALFEPMLFSAVDGATIRFADTYDNKPRGTNRSVVNGYLPKYVQVYDSVIRAEFYPWEMCFGIRNPSTNINLNNYGVSELEDLVTTVTAMLNADKYNGAFFRQGSSPKGALMVKKGNINKDAVAQVRRDWNAMLSGADNSHKTLILDAENVEWVDMNIKNKDMEFSQFQEYLIKMACAIFCISPEEIGFPLAGANKGLGSKEGGQQEKDYSRDKGLKPLLTYIQSWINKYIIGPKTNFQYEFQFAGLDAETITEEADRDNKDVMTHITPDELRRKKNLPPLPDGTGKYPLSPVIAQMVQGKQQQEQEAKNSQQEKDDAQFSNTNPFMDEASAEDDSNPFAKSAMEYFERAFVV